MLVYSRNVRVLLDTGVAEFISGDKIVTGSRQTYCTYCACAETIVTKVAENGVALPK